MKFEYDELTEEWIQILDDKTILIIYGGNRKKWAEYFNSQNSEPFGYFKAEPFGWTDCAESDEGAVALYEKPQPDQSAYIKRLEDALQLAKITFIANKMDVKNVMEVINDALATKENKDG